MRARWFSILLLLLSAWAPYVTSLPGAFVFDDIPAIQENPDVQGVQGVPHLLSLERQSVAYRPVRYFSFMVDWTIGGGSPVAFHITNLLIHGACALLAWRLFLAVGFGTGVALAGACLFAVHPLQTESVAYVSGRRDILCALWYFAGLLLLLQPGVQDRHLRPDRVRDLMAVVCFVLASFTKEAALTFPFVALVLCTVTAKSGMGGFKKGRGLISTILVATSSTLRFRSFAFVVLAVATTAVAAVSFYAYHVHVMSMDPARLSVAEVPERGWLVLQTISWEFRKMIVPWPQIADLSGLFPKMLRGETGWTAFWNGGTVSATSAGSALFLCLVWALTRWTDWRCLIALLVAVLLLLPVSNLIPLAEPVAEHYLYLPLAACSVVLVSSAWRLLTVIGIRRYRWAAFVAVAVLATIAVSSGVRARTWVSPEGFWHSVLSQNPNSSRAHNNYGLMLLERGDVEGARSAFREACSLGENPPVARAAANLLTLERSCGRLREAEWVGRWAVAAHPDNPVLLTQLGEVLLDLSRPDEAAQMLDRVADLPVGYIAIPSTWSVARGLARFAAGDTSTGYRLLAEEVSKHPTDPLSLTALGTVLISMKRPAQAESLLTLATMEPGVNGSAYRNLAVARFLLGRSAEAMDAIDEARSRDCPVPSTFVEQVAAAIQSGSPRD